MTNSLDSNKDMQKFTSSSTIGNLDYGIADEEFAKIDVYLTQTNHWANLTDNSVRYCFKKADLIKNTLNFPNAINCINKIKNIEKSSLRI